MQVTIKVFGPLTDIVRENDLVMNDVHDTDQMVQKLGERYPALHGAPYNIAVDKNIIDKNTVFTGDHIVALLPPYAGG